MSEIKLVPQGRQMPLVTIIVPIYKVTRYVRRTVRSIAQQTYTNIETIVVNDASPDQSVLVAKRAAENLANVRFIDLPENGGLGNARNVGIEAALGKYIFFLDSDDWIAPTAIEKAVTKAEAGCAQVTVVDYMRVNYDSQTRTLDRGPYRASPLRSFSPLLDQHVFRVFNLAQIKLYEREYLNAHGFRFQTDVIYEDVDWTFKTLSSAERVAIVDEPLYFYRVARPGSILSTPGRQHLDIIKQYARTFEFIRTSGRIEALQPIYEYALVAFYHVLIASNRVPKNYRRDFYIGASQVIREARGEETFKVAWRPRPSFERALLSGSYERYLVWRVSRRLEARANRLKGRIRRRWKRTIAPRIASLRDALRRKIFSTNIIEFKPLEFVFGKARNCDVFFESYWGDQFADSPKYLYNYLKIYYPEVRCSFAVKAGIGLEIPEDDRVEFGSRQYRFAIRNAKVLINNNNFGGDGSFRRADKQLFIQTFHGIPLKTLGVDIIGHVDEAPTNYPALVGRCATWDYFVSSGAYHTECIRGAFETPARFLEVGSPRTDALQEKSYRDRCRLKVREHFGLPESTRLVLYAPTWRTGAGDHFLSIDELGEIARAIGGDVQVLVRMHHFTKNTAASGPSVLDASAFVDGQELIAASDLLITDYSSIAFDFATTGGVPLFFVPDYEEFAIRRGLYLDMFASFKGLVHTQLTSLTEACRAMIDDGPDRQAANEEMRNLFMESERPDTCRTVVDQLIMPFLVSGKVPPLDTV